MSDTHVFTHVKARMIIFCVHLEGDLNVHIVVAALEEDSSLNPSQILGPMIDLTTSKP